MLYDFLIENELEILAMTESKSLELAGIRPSSDQLKKGLPIFYRQLLGILLLHATPADDSSLPRIGKPSPAVQADEAELAKSAGVHGKELLRLGYTLSHVVHAYGSMCQSITQLAMGKRVHISAREFRDLNQCLDIAIASAVTEFQSKSSGQVHSREVQHLGFLAHELRNALTVVNISLQLIKRGTVGFGGNTGQVLDRALQRIETLIERSLTEVRLRVDPDLDPETMSLLQIVDQIAVTANIEAQTRNITLEININPSLMIYVDQQLFYSALSNLVQNAVKYTRTGGLIQIRGNMIGKKIVVEVEDECGGLSDTAIDLFKPYEQQNEDKKGLGLGLTIARRAMELNQGTIEVENLPTKGCIFKITLPTDAA